VVVAGRRNHRYRHSMVLAILRFLWCDILRNYRRLPHLLASRRFPMASSAVPHVNKKMPAARS
jgi:hypothetical protein